MRLMRFTSFRFSGCFMKIATCNPSVRFTMVKDKAMYNRNFKTHKGTSQNRTKIKTFDMESRAHDLFLRFGRFVLESNE